MSRYDNDPARAVRDHLSRYRADPARTRAAINAALQPGPSPVRLAAAALEGLMADWAPEDRAAALDALHRDLADGGRISVAVVRDEMDGLIDDAEGNLR
jgi:hypothetical protein